MPISSVLLVDDDADLRRIGQLSLKNVGKWNVFVASCGSEALIMAVECKPDVILLDVMMPGMDGPTTLVNLRKSDCTAQVPVIFLTAKVQTHEVNDYINLGACGVIIKPFDPMKLPEQVLAMVRC